MTSVDDAALHEAFEQSQDTHSDAMRLTRAGLSDYVEAAQDARADRARTVKRASALAMLTGGGLLAAASGAFAADDADVAALQTAAGIENLAVFAYQQVPKLSYAKSLPAVVGAFATMTLKQHQEHAQAFNAAAKNLGGKEQTNPSPGLLSTGQKLLAAATAPAGLLTAAITLENVAAETYVKAAGTVSTGDLRQLFTSVAGVEAQHVSVLLAVQALLAGNLVDEIKLGPDLTKLPAAAGSVGFPNAYYKTDMADDLTEGAVK
ncbi:MAG TPA: ferritin-like domain-containing protein [Mycobacteriales bacterium]|nr:ferritin-like domain-containing protein [Mycobacteriales bacterium]